MSGQGVGNCWQSAIVPVYSGWTQVPTKAIPTLSVWMRGMGLRAHVLPFGTTGQTESSTYLAAFEMLYMLPLFHMMAWEPRTKSSGISWKSCSVHGILSAGQRRYW
jgi:hypothetical protein